MFNKQDKPKQSMHDDDPTVVITGASGLLGRALMQRFAPLHPIGCAFSRAGKGLEKVDLTDELQVAAFLAKTQPNVIIHAAAERRPDVCAAHEADALKLNVAATKSLAEQAKKIGAWLLYISTDYVFDGTSPPYKPDDPTHPVNFYGQSKLAGEEAIKQSLSAYGILRVGLLYGEIEKLEESIVTMLIPLLDQAQVDVDHYYKKYPVHTMDVANACWYLVQKAYSSPQFNGTFHYCSQEPLTKYELLTVMAKQLDRSMEHVNPILQPSSDVARPYDCALNCEALHEMGVAPARPFEQGIVPIMCPSRNGA